MYATVDVATALAENRAPIDALRRLCATEIARRPDEFGDDLFLLRFCLSHKADVDTAVKALRASTDFRVKHAETLAKLRDGWQHPDEALLHIFAPAALHAKAAKDGSPVMLIRSGIADVDRAMKYVGAERIKTAMIFQKEIMYARCDKETRARGRLVKVISINDMAGLGFTDFNRGFMGVMGEAVKEMEFVYPQLLGTTIIVNPPFFMRAMMAVAQLVLPQSTFEKIKVCRGGATEGRAMAECPFVSSQIDADALPSYLGGKCTCADVGGCVTRLANEQNTKIDPVAAKAKFLSMAERATPAS